MIRFLVGFVTAMLILYGCGYSSMDNELIGQAKKVVHHTPLIFCEPYYEVDVSLGVFRNGIGSASKEDVWLYIPNPEHVKVLQHAVETGAVVKIRYDVKRMTLCVDNNFLRAVDIVP